MDFQLSEDRIMIQDMARKFASERLRPNAMRWDEEKTLDRDVLQEAGSLGFGAIYAREDVGGSALTRLDAALIFEALSAGDVSHAAFLSIHNMATWMIDTYGNEEQRQKWVPRLAPLELIASYCLTEPSSGSDAASLRTRAERDGDHYVLNGSKAFISGAGFSDIYVVMVRTGEPGPKGISTLVVEKDTPGLSFGANEKKMGWNAQPTGIVNFDNCRVPVANRLGEEGQGFKIAMSGLDGGRINIGACSLGGAQEALDRAVEYAKTRQQFGRAIADFQVNQFKLADMATELEAARLLLYRAASALDAGDPAKTRLSAMAKRLATDTGFRVANEALQIHGGYGYLKDYEIERIVRDLRVHQILEGTNEIMRVVISREMLRG
ncbi:acyl-CoA dehydrogenase family protein [Pedomonas sp. V897]|uniref:acyl-CoA dehydrogenase family protein n=1 Tax=Pedomonas sp. V897 TaxID=3446482 RepID=UPI003EE28669